MLRYGGWRGCWVWGQWGSEMLEWHGQQIPVKRPPPRRASVLSYQFFLDSVPFFFGLRTPLSKHALTELTWSCMGTLKPIFHPHVVGFCPASPPPPTRVLPDSDMAQLSPSESTVCLPPKHELFGMGDVREPSRCKECQSAKKASQGYGGRRVPWRAYLSLILIGIVLYRWHRSHLFEFNYANSEPKMEKPHHENKKIFKINPIFLP